MTTQANGKDMTPITPEQYESLKNVLTIYADYLLSTIDKSYAVLAARVEISKSLNDEREMIYYSGALEQTRIYIDMVYNSLREIDKLYAGQDTFKKKKKKRIKRIAVLDKNSSIYKKLKGKRK